MINKEQVIYNTGFIHGAYNAVNGLLNLIEKNTKMGKSEVMELLLKIKSEVGIMDNHIENQGYELQLIINQFAQIRQLTLLETDLEADYIGYASFD
jgi:hypothetical protein